MPIAKILVKLLPDFVTMAVDDAVLAIAEGDLARGGVALRRRGLLVLAALITLSVSITNGLLLCRQTKCCD